MAYDNTNRGFLMKNERARAGSKDPSHTGTLDVDGRKFKLAAWVNESKGGRKYFAITVKPDDQQGAGSQRNGHQLDDDISF